jgi:hypothetical protein
VSEVVYIGALTKYTVALDAGAELVVFQQNLRTSSMEAIQVKGRPVRLTWGRENNRPVMTAGGDVPSDPDQGAKGGTA